MKFVKNREILRIRCRSGSGGAAKLKNVKITCSKCCKESIFQFSAKSDNIYYAYLQSGQNHTLIPPPLQSIVPEVLIFLVEIDFENYYNFVVHLS